MNIYNLLKFNEQKQTFRLYMPTALGLHLVETIKIKNLALEPPISAQAVAVSEADFIEVQVHNISPSMLVALAQMSTAEMMTKNNRR